VRIHAARFSESDEGLVIVGSASHNTPETDDFVADYKARARTRELPRLPQTNSHICLRLTPACTLAQSPKFTALGSSLKLLLVAEGAAHVYPRLAPTCEWDTAAAHAIVTEAGGEVLVAGECDSKGKMLPGVSWRDALAKQEAVRYNKPAPLNPFFVVYGARAKKA
jgi:hypothetical protein